MIVAGRLTPEKLVMLEASIWYAKRVILIGEVGLKFVMAPNTLPQVLNVKLSPAESRAITNLLKRMTT